MNEARTSRRIGRGDNFVGNAALNTEQARLARTNMGRRVASAKTLRVLHDIVDEAVTIVHKQPRVASVVETARQIADILPERIADSA